MKIHDISMKISFDMPVYQNRNELRPVHKIIKNYENSNSFNSNIDINMHAGTHVDAPLHMVEGGLSIDKSDLACVIGHCRVIDLTGVKDRITASDLEGKNILKGEIILLKTQNSFTEELGTDYIFVERTGADYLKNAAIKCVGIDSLGIERDQKDHYTHKTLLGAGILIIEGLRLKQINEGTYFLCAAPLYIEGAEAAPARAVLIECPQTSASLSGG